MASPIGRAGNANNRVGDPNMRTEQDPIESAPDEVRAFLREARSLRNLDLCINPLTLDESRRYSMDLQSTPVGHALGLIALDDANDSNPYCYISRGIAQGMVVHFSHDDEPEIRFHDLASFRRSLMAALDQGLDIDDLPCEPLGPFDDQQGLIRTLTDLIDRGDDDAEFLLCLLLPLLVPKQISIIERLACHESFFVRERLAEFIASHPRAEHHSVARRLSEDQHPQVARPGKVALSRVKRTRRQDGSHS